VSSEDGLNMKNGIHFISGLPHSGSTLLAVLLLQNPAACGHHQRGWLARWYDPAGSKPRQ